MPEFLRGLLTWVGGLSISLTAVVAAVKFVAWIWDRTQPHRDRRRIARQFGSTLYDPHTIRHSTLYYIEPACSSLDPAQEQEMRHLISPREQLFALMDRHLDSPGPRRHILLLADSGMGKSSFVLNYWARNQRRAHSKRHRIAVVPLRHHAADGYIASLSLPEQTTLLLDGLDEDEAAIADHRSRVSEIMHLCQGFKSVVITCRSQFFPADQEIPTKTGVAQLGPRSLGRPGEYEFWKVYLSPFDEAQIRSYLKRRFPVPFSRSRQDALAIAKKIPLLMARPMLLDATASLVAERHYYDASRLSFEPISHLNVEHAFQLYEVLVNNWYIRESNWVQAEQLREFSERLAVDLIENRSRRRGEHIPRQELEPLARSWGLDLSEWELSSRSLLNRDADGNYKFSHRSFLEFFLARLIMAGQLRIEDVPMSDQIESFIWEMTSDMLSEGRLPPYPSHLTRAQASLEQSLALHGELCRIAADGYSKGSHMWCLVYDQVADRWRSLEPLRAAESNRQKPVALSDEMAEFLRDAPPQSPPRELGSGPNTAWAFPIVGPDVRGAVVIEFAQPGADGQRMPLDLIRRLTWEFTQRLRRTDHKDAPR
jgi:hypothetical protein